MREPTTTTTAAQGTVLSLTPPPSLVTDADDDPLWPSSWLQRVVKSDSERSSEVARSETESEPPSSPRPGTPEVWKDYYDVVAPPPPVKEVGFVTYKGPPLPDCHHWLRTRAPPPPPPVPMNLVQLSVCRLTMFGARLRPGSSARVIYDRQVIVAKEKGRLPHEAKDLLQEIISSILEAEE